MSKALESKSGSIAAQFRNIPETMLKREPRRGASIHRLFSARAVSANI